MAVRRELVNDESGGAARRRRQAHAPKENRKTRTEKRGGGRAIPAEPLGIGCRFSRRAMLSDIRLLSVFPVLILFPIAFFLCYAPVILLFSVGYGSIDPRGRQCPQNRRLKLL